MPSSDYGNAVGGGLKLKGSGGIKKKKKKDKKPATAVSAGEEPVEASQREVAGEDVEKNQNILERALADDGEHPGTVEAKEQAEEIKEYGKTEAQRRFEERRKHRLDERLKREGVHTHKERVQQLNKYLSSLSEHNDMPRIGPG